MAFSAATATGTQAVTGVGFSPKALINMSADTVEGISTNAKLNFGFCDSALNQRSMSNSVEDDGVWNNGSNTRRDVSTGVIIDSCAIASGTHNTMTGAITSLDSDGMTYNWTVKDGTAQQIIVLALGDAASAGGAGANGQNLLLRIGN